MPTAQNQHTEKGRLMPGMSKHIDTPSARLHYLDYGGQGARGVVMLHGGGANSHWYDFVGPSLAPHYHALSLDLRGHGDSAHTEPPVYTYDAYMDDIQALLHAEQLQQPILMGHSMGGMLLVRYTGLHPTDIGALVVCDARPTYGEDDQARLMGTANRPGREYDTQADYIDNFRIRPDSPHTPPEVLRYIAGFGGKQLPQGTWMHKIDRRTYAQRQMIDTLPFYQQITCPVLYLWASHSRVTAEMVDQLRLACPHAEITPVPNSGHHVTLDQPELTVALVTDFLRRHQLAP